MMKHEQFDPEAYTAICHRLIKEKGSDAQREFLIALRERDLFIAWADDNIACEHGASAERLVEPLTEGSFKNMPIDIETAIYETWRSVVSPAQACSNAFWGIVTLRQIEGKIIAPYFLAASNGNLSGGATRIDHMLSNGTAQDIDKVVRDALRRMGGLRQARGNRSVYVDCPFARAWWRGYFADEVMRNAEIDAEYKKIMAVFRLSQNFWEKLIDFIVSRNSTMGYTCVRDALFWGLSELSKEALASLTANTLAQKLRHLALRSAVQEFGIFDINELKSIIDSEIWDRG